MFNSKQYQKNYRKIHKQKIKKYMHKYYQKNKFKLLTYCKNWRLKNSEKKKLGDKKWIEKHKEHIKEYRRKNKEEIKRQHRRYEKLHKKRLRKIRQLYFQKNKEKIYIKRKQRYYRDINYRLTCILRRRINNTIRRNSKSAKTMDLIGCTISELKKHLQNQFKKGMSWKNYGYYGWHIDHKIPCFKFDLSKAREQKKCFNYKNLRPLWRKENQQQSRKKVAEHRELKVSKVSSLGI